MQFGETADQCVVKIQSGSVTFSEVVTLAHLYHTLPDRPRLGSRPRKLQLISLITSLGTVGQIMNRFSQIDECPSQFGLHGRILHRSVMVNSMRTISLLRVPHDRANVRQSIIIIHCPGQKSMDYLLAAGPFYQQIPWSSLEPATAQPPGSHSAPIRLAQPQNYLTT